MSLSWNQRPLSLNANGSSIHVNCRPTSATPPSTGNTEGGDDRTRAKAIARLARRRDGGVCWTLTTVHHCSGDLVNCRAANRGVSRVRWGDQLPGAVVPLPTLARVAALSPYGRSR
jgi:hypothetical protein